jgi:hypothetical protein
MGVKIVVLRESTNIAHGNTIVISKKYLPIQRRKVKPNAIIIALG